MQPLNQHPVVPLEGGPLVRAGLGELRAREDLGDVSAASVADDHDAVPATGGDVCPLASDEGISTNILADRLQRLEQDGVIEKEIDPDHRSRSIYRLTQKGKDLLPVMLEITAWSGKYDSKTNAPAPLLKALKKDRRPLIAKILSDLDET